MWLYRSWTRSKCVIVVLLILCRFIGQHIIGVNCNFNHFHSILMRNTFPCAINTLCMCTNAGKKNWILNYWTFQSKLQADQNRLFSVYRTRLDECNRLWLDSNWSSERNLLPTRHTAMDATYLVAYANSQNKRENSVCVVIWLWFYFRFFFVSWLIH